MPREVVRDLGGAEALADAGFHRAEVLRDGAVLAQANPDFRTYGAEAARPVWTALRGALRPGVPRRPGGMEPPSHLWPEDAAR
ncbi:hypothetical protein [Kitasatospora camelliae]|uniref:Uncharacterized protein n=1 Tax=Kitasatospora camelliae TaxID=3156397 RepID=A0AAU8JQ28_9ACTN